MLLCHAREASSGSGLPRDNKNNHPFVNEDLSIALIHNGRVPNHVYNFLKNKYEVHTLCDSEILLRLFQSGFYKNEEKIENRLLGINNLWSMACESHMAVAIGELSKEEKRLWLFRNEHRSLFYVDMMDLLGQVFFVSTAEIWSDSTREFNFDCEAAQLPTDEVWLFELSEELKINKFDIISEEIDNWIEDGNFLNFEKPKLTNKIYTNLNLEEQCEDFSLENYNLAKYKVAEIINYSYELESIIENSSDYDFLIDNIKELEKIFLNILNKS